MIKYNANGLYAWNVKKRGFQMTAKLASLNGYHQQHQMVGSKEERG